MSKEADKKKYDKGGIKTRDFITAKGLDYNEGNVVKYIVRHKEKNGLDDILKAINYLEYIRDNYED
jgi:hypothetical protein